MRTLPNAETRWQRKPELLEFRQADVEQRLGPCAEPITLLSGGLANLNLRIGDERVLRIYRRDAKELPKEAALLQRNWTSFRVPRVLDRGTDYLLLEYVEHAPLPDSEGSGALVGTALAEVHEQAFAMHGDFDSEGTVIAPMPDFPEALGAHTRSEVLKGPAKFRDLAELAFAHLDARYERLTQLCADPRRLHGDFKASNLHLAADGRLLVLDWEFAYAGPTLMDVGQLLRWTPGAPFLHGFARAYHGAGGDLPEDWQRVCADFDLANLAGLLGGSEAGSRRATDVAARIRATLGPGQ